MYQITKGTSDFKDYVARMFYYGEVRGEDMQTEKSGSRSQLCYDMTYSQLIMYQYLANTLYCDWTRKTELLKLQKVEN
ncbi:hypothetical protein NXV27_21270 [Bacteroides fragilis]|nr:hypothetical protein [Bacteroides fragilis]